LWGVYKTHFLGIFDKTSKYSIATWKIEALLDVSDYFSFLFLLKEVQKQWFLSSHRLIE
jgi:hypothetical protein